MPYLEHFGLREAPFRITPDTDFFFVGARRGATLEALIYAITHDEGIVKVSGEVGSGKTMLCRMLLEKLPSNVETVYLANPMLSRDEILFAIAEELRISLPEGRSHLLLRALHERLLEIYAGGRQLVALIDEAHAMPTEALEEIRQLSNLESNQRKLLQIVLFGQPELDQRLRETTMRQLNERITHHFRLQPLQTPDVAVYLMFRLRAAGYHGPDLYTPGAIALISKASAGLTRRINLIADKAMLAAYSAGGHQIGRREVRAAIRDAQFAPLQRRSVYGWRVAAAGAGVLVMLVAAYLAGSRHLPWVRPFRPQSLSRWQARAVSKLTADWCSAWLPPSSGCERRRIITTSSSCCSPVAAASARSWTSLTNTEHCLIPPKSGSIAHESMARTGSA